MPTYLLTWNPKKWPIEEMEVVVAQFREQGRVFAPHSCGGTKRIAPGDRILLLRQGQEPRGLVGAGLAVSGVYSGPHWDNKSKEAHYVDVEWDYIDSEPLIPREVLDSDDFSSVHWNTQASGIEVPSAVASKVWALWESTTADGGVLLDEDLDSQVIERVFEGGVLQVLVNRYERAPLARRRCLEHWGFNCQVCHVDLSKAYGVAGKRVIQVHHRVPLSEIKKDYLVDPVNDLIPVCPNCHVALHSRRPIYSVDELRQLIADQRVAST